MTVITIITARDMRWVLAGRGSAVVARATSTQDLRMVDGIGRRKYVCVVTILANIGCLYVRRTLADGIETVVTACTIIDDTEVIKVCRPPASCRMAVIAGIAARNMRWMLAGRDDAVVATVAGADNLGMVNSEDWRKDVGVMAIFANIAGENMCRVLANGIDAVMAVNTLTSDIQMVEVGWQPGYR